MKLKLFTPSSNKHDDIVACVGWIGNNELFSCGDDKKILKWNSDAETLGQLSTSLFDSAKPTMSAANLVSESAKGLVGAVSAQSSIYITNIQWFPIPPGKGQTTAEMFAAAGTDGKFYFCLKNGRVEKAVDAHRGAVLGIKWNYEGSAILSAGEDGSAKIWSRSGMLRTSLIQLGYPIYAIAWSPDNDQILLTNGKNLIIKPLQPSMKSTQWKAHEGVILCVDWNFVNNLIISGGEDRKYKIWDSFGRQLFSSSAQDHPITSLAWNPAGDLFAVGSFDSLRLCDKLGWSYSLEKPQSGSIFHMAWTPDGTQIACGGGNGSIVFGHVVNRVLEWKNYEVTILEDNKIQVHDVLQGNYEMLDFRDRLTKASLGFGHLIVATSTQCYVYSDKNWNTPCIIDISNNGRVVCIKQCSDYFCLVDNFTGIQIYSYEARLISSPKYPGLRPELITDASISLSNDTLALKDRTDECALYFFDVQSGRQLLEAPFKHTTEILSISLNQSATTTSTRQILILDKNHDLYLTSSILSRTTTRPSHPSDKKPTSTSTSKKLASMVETAAWNDDGSDMICGMADARFVIWCYPNVLFVDEDVFPLTKFERDGGVFGKGASIVQFFGTRCTLRKADGTIVNASNFSPFPGLLQECVRKKQWEEAIRLCRFAKMKELWACLAAMAIHGQDLNTAEVAYASIDEIQKVQYICYIRDIPSAERRAAEMALLRKQPKEAEGILLSANLVYRAIRMWVGLFEWDRALEIAVKYKTHVDTVLYLREKYLTQTGRKEYLKKYVQYSQGVKVDVDAIKAKILMEEST